MKKSVNIIGTRGIPGNYGGFETFAERLSLYLVGRGWDVNVYCQINKSEKNLLRETEWNRIRQINIAAKDSSAGTIFFDIKSAMDAKDRGNVDLVLGYNTGFLSVFQRLYGQFVVINMDGIEWRRQKWSLPAKVWFFLNELVAANVSHAIIADHPKIEQHLRNRTYKRPVMIPYGADPIREAPWVRISGLDIKPDRYFISVCRIVPENSILEIVRSYIKAAPQGVPLVVLGKLDERDPYHREVRAAANGAVLFPGAIYDKEALASLRSHARAYVHGHQVGGTNPSLVEALGAGSAVLAHDNRFNRWTAGEKQFYFASEEACREAFAKLAQDDHAIAAAREAAWQRFEEAFQWHQILHAYECLLEKAVARSAPKQVVRFGQRFGGFLTRQG